MPVAANVPGAAPHAWQATHPAVFTPRATTCDRAPLPPAAEHFLAFLQRFLAFLRQRLAVAQVQNDTPASFLQALQEVRPGRAPGPGLRRGQGPRWPGQVA